MGGSTAGGEAAVDERHGHARAHSAPLERIGRADVESQTSFMPVSEQPRGDVDYEVASASAMLPATSKPKNARLMHRLMPR